ncbi:MAG: phosphoglycerate mutase family protein, partial [Promethearchaeota archaeon]
MEILSKVSWSAPALKLISHVHVLNPSNSAFLIIRHSAREESEDIQKTLNAPLTKQGKKAAFEFGQSLPTHFMYHFYHSIIERCKETALYIEKGIRDNGGKTRYYGDLEILTHIKGNQRKIIEFMGR